MIETAAFENLLQPFCYIHGKDTLRHFSLLGGFWKQLKFQSYLYKTKNQTKNFNRTVISSHLRKGVGLIAVLSVAPPTLFLKAGE